MTRDYIDFDHWSNETLVAAPIIDEANLVVETIEGVKPLDEQFGAHPPKTVPDALYKVLLDQPEPTKVELEKAEGNPAQVPPMQTYAILDAAKLPNLAIALDTSGLEYRCLFKGDTYEELKDVAPYIIRLEEGNDFTRFLFTRGKAPWHLWDKEPGIYLRSRESLDPMWRHFRKFTRIQDDNGKWFYFRFWEPNNVEAIIKRANDASSPLVSVWHPDIIDRVIIPSLSRTVVIRPTPDLMSSRKTVRLAAEDIQALKDVRSDAFTQKIFYALSIDHPDLYKQTNFETIKQLHSQGFARGYKIEMALYNFVRANLYAASLGLTFENLENHLDPNNVLSSLSRSKKIWEHLNNHDE